MVVAVVDLIKINTHLQKSIEELQTIENHRDNLEFLATINGGRFRFQFN